MKNSVDHSLVEHLLENETLSYREIAKRANCSDWSVRAIDRKLANDSRPMKRDRYEREDDGGESLAIAGWLVLAGIVIALILALWMGMRGIQPPEI